MRFRSYLLPSLEGYRGSWLTPDLLAGLALATIAVPEQMATARLAGMPVVIGLYAFIGASLAFALLGYSKHVSVGADSTIAPVLAAGVGAIAAAGSAKYSALMALTAILLGILLGLVGLLRLGWISDFLPSPVVVGLLAGIGVQILIHQLPTVLGTPGGGRTTVGRLELIFDQRGYISGWAILTAGVSLIVIVAAQRIDHRVPGPLLAVSLSTAAVAVFGLRHHLAVVGSFQSGMPKIGLPSFTAGDALHLAGTASTAAFLCIVQTAATTRSTGRGTDGRSNLNRDLAAVGAANLLAGFTGSFGVNASPPRTAVVESTRGRTQVASLVAAALTVAVVTNSSVLQDLPQATLGAVLLFVAGRLFRLDELLRVRRFDRIEFGVAVLTVVVVALLGVEQGVLTAAVLALAQRIRLSARPRGVLLGREPGSDHWIPSDIGRPTEQVPGVLVYMPYAPLWYGNASFVCAQMLAAVKDAAVPVEAFVLDADGMSDVDYTAAREVEKFALELRSRGIKLGVARSSHLVHHDLKHSGLLTDIGPQHIYLSVQEAVTSLGAEKPGADLTPSPP